MRRLLLLLWLSACVACRSGYLAPPEPCAEVRCSGHGTCGLTKSGEVYCLCDPGFDNLGATKCEPVLASDAGLGREGGISLDASAGRDQIVAADAALDRDAAVTQDTLVLVDASPSPEAGSGLLAFTPPTPDEGAEVSSEVLLVGTCRAGAQIGFSGDIVASPPSNCDDLGTFSEQVTLDAPDGLKTVSVAQQDPGGGETVISRQLVRDTAAPLVAFCCETPEEGSTISQFLIDLVGTCEEGLDVTLSGSLAIEVLTPCSGGSFSTQAQLDDGGGEKTVEATQLDAAGNRGSDARSFTLVSGPGTLRLTGPTLIQAGVCRDFRVDVIDTLGQSVGVQVDTQVVLAGERYGNFYDTAGCGGDIITALTLTAGQSGTDVYYRSSEDSKVAFEAMTTGLQSGDLSVTVMHQIELFQAGGGDGLGQLWYNARGPTFQFSLDAQGLNASADYTLLYFPDHVASPRSGTGLVCLASGSSSDSGELSFGGSGLVNVELDADLPKPIDDNFYTGGGARVLLVPSLDALCNPPAGAPTGMNSWNESAYLVSNSRISYNDSGVSYLVSKDTDWVPIQNGAVGKVLFDESSSSFDFTASFSGLSPRSGYTLIYYHDPWPGDDLICLGGGDADDSGALLISDQLVTVGLPAFSDPNYSYAKLWLMQDSDVNCGASQVQSLGTSTTVFDYGDGLRFVPLAQPRADVLGADGDVVSAQRCKSSAPVWQSLPMPPSLGASYTLWLTAKPVSDTARSVLGLSAQRAASELDLGVTILFDSDGSISVYDGLTNDYTADTDIGYVVGSKGIYRLRIDVDMLTDRFSVDVLPGTDNGVWTRLATDYSMRSGPAPVDSFGFLGFAALSGPGVIICGSTVN